MPEEKRDFSFGKALVALGTIGLVLSFFGQGFLGRAVAGFFLPSLILLFIGRALARRERRRPMEEIEQTPADRPPRPVPPSPPKPRPEMEAPSRVDADVEKALAAYRTEMQPDAEAIAIPVEPPKTDEFQAKTSAEMIEEAKRRISSSKNEA